MTDRNMERQPGELPEELDEFIRATQAKVRDAAYFTCQNREVAEDVVQETYIAVLGMWTRLLAMDRPEAYLKKVAVNKAKDGAGRRGKEAAAWLLVGMPRQAPVPLTVEVRRVLDTFHQLPPRQSEVLWRFCLEAQTYEEIAHELNIAKGAVGATVSKARKNLAKRLGLDPDEGWNDYEALVDAPSGGLRDSLVTELLDTQLYLQDAFESDEAGVDLLLINVAEAWLQLTQEHS